MFDSESFDTGAFSTDAWDFGGAVLSGGFVLSGTAALLLGAVFPASGEVVFSGVPAALVSSVSLSASGTALFSGSAALNFQSALGSNTRQRPLTGVGE